MTRSDASASTMLVRRASNALGSAADATIARYTSAGPDDVVATGGDVVNRAGEAGTHTASADPRRAASSTAAGHARDVRSILTPSNGNEPTPTGERRQSGAE